MLVAALALQLVLVALDVVLGPGLFITSAYLLPPVLVATYGDRRTAAGFALLAVALAALSGAWHADATSAAYLTRLGVVALASGLAVGWAVAREGAARRARRWELLAGIGAAEILSLEQTAQELAALVVPALADLCLVNVNQREPDRDSEDRYVPLAVRARGPEAARLEAAIVRMGIDPLQAAGPTSTAGSGTRAYMVGEVDPERLTVFGDREERELVDALDLRSHLSVPLRTRGRVLGNLSLAIGGTRRFDGDALRYIGLVADRAALAIDNAMLIAQLTESEARIDAILSGVAEAVTVQDREGRIVYANDAAARLLGFDDPAEVMRSPAASIAERFALFDEAGRRLSRHEMPGARVLAGEDAPPALTRSVFRPTGEEHWLLTKATPVRDTAGRVALAVNVIENVTEVKRAEFAQRLLAGASELLASALDYEATLEKIARLAVPKLADWCAVDLLDERGAIELVAVAHSDPGRALLGRELRARYPIDAAEPGGVAAVIRRGGCELHNDISDAMLERSARDEEHARLMREFALRAAMIVPVVAGEGVIGAMTFATSESDRNFTDADLALAQELAKRAGNAVEIARLYGQRSTIAETLQRSLLPPHLPDVHGWQAAGSYRAAGVGNEVGGDFYDLIPMERGCLVIIGDVAGKGIAAAGLTSLVRHTISAVASVTGSLRVALAETNAALRRRSDYPICTVACVLLLDEDDKTSAEVVCAGHPRPIVVRGREPRYIGRPGPLLGAFGDAEWDAERVRFEHEDALVLYTDGVVDTVGGHERFGERRLLGALRRADSVVPESIVAHLGGELERFEEGPQRDDRAVLVLTRTAITHRAPSGRAHAGAL